jgi:hypothetical protein
MVKKVTRTFKEIKIGGREAYVLFDTDSTKSYVRKGLVSGPIQRTAPFRVGLGGRIYEIDEVCLLNCEIEGLGFDMKAHPVEELGYDERGRRIDAIVGALTMEDWVLIPDPKTGKIDLTVLRKREFTEFKSQKIYLQSSIVKCRKKF